MAREKKIEGPVTVFAAIETEKHQALREIAFKERRSIADVVRDAISQYVAKRRERGQPPAGLRPAIGPPRLVL